MNLISILHNSIRIMTPFLLAAIGGLFTEMSGMLNVALEGQMLTSAFFSVMVAGLSGSAEAGLAAGILSSAALAFIFGFSSLKLKTNIFISGIATNLLASSLTVLIASQLLGRQGVYRFGDFLSLRTLRIPAWTGALGQVLLGHTSLVYISWLVVLLASLLIYRTPLGLKIRATGYDDRTVRTLGLKPDRYRLIAVLVSGITCGLAGAHLSLNLEAFVPNITAGRGWIALVIIYLGYKRPAGIIIASFLFGLAESLSNFSQGFFNLPADIILAFPYLVSVMALIVYSVLNKNHSRNRVF